MIIKGKPDRKKPWHPWSDIVARLIEIQSETQEEIIYYLFWLIAGCCVLVATNVAALMATIALLRRLH
jgi:hypothetical protein